MPDKSAALVAQLRPWHAALRELGSPDKHIDKFEPTPVETSPPTLWITDESLVSSVHVLGGKPTISKVRKLEAVALLDLLARVDNTAWEQTILQVWPEPDLQEWIEDRSLDPLALPCRVGIWISNVCHRHTGKLTKLCKTTTRDVVSSAFAALYASMEAQLETTQLNATSWQVPLRVDLDLTDLAPYQLASLLESVFKCVLQCRVNAAPATALNKVIVQIEHVEIADMDDPVFDTKSLSVWKELTDFGVRVNKLPDFTMEMYMDSWKTIVENARSLLSVPGSIAPGGMIAPGVETIILSTRNAPQCFPGLVAAAQVSPSLRMAEIDIAVTNDDASDEDDDYDTEQEQERLASIETYWRWIAYGLFSRHASHQISTLRLDMTEFPPSCVEIIRAIVSAPDPLARFYDVHEKREPMRQLTASRLHLMDPDGATHTYVYNADGTKRLLGVDPQQLVLTTKTPITVRVIYPPQNDDDPYWTVMIPGHGDGWVHKDDMTDLTETARPTDDDVGPKTRSFEAIEMEIAHDASKEAALDLLKMIGHGTKRIMMNKYDGEGCVDDCIEAVLVACPHLEEFVVRGGDVRSIESFAALAATGTSRLERLVLVSACDGYGAFFEALADVAHPLAVHLKTLCVGFSIDHKRDVDAFMTGVLKMLERNRRLQWVELTLRLGGECASQRPMLEAAVAKATDTKVAVRTAALDVRKKLAVLSAVQYHAAAATASVFTALGQLDSCVLGTIFEFAAQARMRRVAIHCMTDMY